MNKMIKVGVIGTGHLGSIHAKLWKQQDNIQFVGIFDSDIERSSNLAKELDIDVFHSIDDAIERCTLITIATPTISHYEIAKKCLVKGIHCFIEKPITSKYQEAVELIDLAINHNAKIQVGHVERFNPALSAINSKEISPKFIEAHRLSQFKPRATDVSVIHDLMIHDIDIILWLIKDKVVSIDANGVAVLTDTIDIANTRIKFEGGAVANLTASRISANPMRKMRIFQNDSYISLDFANQDVDIYSIKDADEPIVGTPATMLGTIELGTKNRNIYFEKPIIKKINAIQEEQRSFIQSIDTDSESAVSALEATEALRIAELISEQIEK